MDDYMQNRALYQFKMPPLDGMQSEGRLRFLYTSVLEFGRPNTKKALEIGCFKGASTVVLAQALNQIGVTSLTSIDLFTGTPGWEQDFDTLKEASLRLKEFNVDSMVHLVRGDSRTVDWTDSIDVLHIDGNHTYEAVSSDINRFIQFVVPGGVAFFDDFDPDHPGVVKAVSEFLLAHSEFELVKHYIEGTTVGNLCIRKKLSQV